MGRHRGPSGPGPPCGAGIPAAHAGGAAGTATLSTQLTTLCGLVGDAGHRIPDAGRDRPTAGRTNPQAKPPDRRNKIATRTVVDRHLAPLPVPPGIEVGAIAPRSAGSRIRYRSTSDGRAPRPPHRSSASAVGGASRAPRTDPPPPQVDDLCRRPQRPWHPDERPRADECRSAATEPRGAGDSSRNARSTGPCTPEPAPGTPECPHPGTDRTIRPPRPAATSANSRRFGRRLAFGRTALSPARNDDDPKGRVRTRSALVRVLAPHASPGRRSHRTRPLWTSSVACTTARRPDWAAWAGPRFRHSA